MRLLFVENRYATRLYAAVATQLMAEGHEIHWLVQNPLFTPSFGQVHKLAFPTGDDAGAGDYAWVRRTDRGVLHFGGEGDHYAHYDRLIKGILQRTTPDMVFGEATQFHELLIIAGCRELGIPYASPNATRYPAGRVCFLAYDTMDPMAGSGETLTDAEALDLVLAIAARSVTPSYMASHRKSRAKTMLVRKLGALRVMAAWAAGERFITPSPLRKMSLDFAQGRAFRRWERLAETCLPSNLPPDAWVLFPLQMQPEGNLDVWGQPWNDQVVVAAEAAQALAKVGGVLVIKPNPKSKYEMTQALCDLVERTPNIVALSHEVSMRSLFDKIPLVLTVTGTVMLECIFAGKPVASLGSHAMARYPGVIALGRPEEVAQVLGSLKSGQLHGASEAEGVKLIQFLHRTSYPGDLFDPLEQPEKLDPVRLHSLVAAFQDLLSRHPDTLRAQTFGD